MSRARKLTRLLAERVEREDAVGSRPRAVLSREETITRFREASSPRPLRSNSLSRRHPDLARSVIFHFGSLRAARRAARIPDPPPERIWTKRRILIELERLHRARVLITYQGLVAAGHRDLLGAVERYFGSLVKARSLAGIAAPARRRMPVRRWTCELVLAEIIARHEKGEPLNRTDIPSALDGAAMYWFGSWRSAVEAAGIDYTKVRLVQPWTRKRLREVLRSHAARAEPIDTAIGHACWRLYGGVAVAWQAAGVARPPKRSGSRPSRKQREVWPRSRVVIELRRNARRGNLAITGALDQQCRDAFGGVREARRAADIDAIVARWTKELLLRWLTAHRRSQIIGGLREVAVRHFGSVLQARIAAGTLRPGSMYSWTKPKILSEVKRRILANSEITPTLTVVCKHSFGSVAAARQAAGVPSSRNWSAKRVIEELRAIGTRIGPLPSKLSTACRRYFGSVKNARATAGVPVHRKFPRERIIAELRAKSRSGDNLGQPLTAAACRMFGTMDAARRAARVPIPRRRALWSKRKLVAELRRRWRHRAIRADAIVYECTRHFGGVRAARRAAGLEALSRSWSKAAVKLELRRNWRDRYISDASVASACSKYFGSIGAARLAAGLPLLKRPHRKPRAR